MSKPIFRFYDKATFRRTGESFVSLITEDDDYKPAYPYTDIPVPDDLQSPDKVAFFDPALQAWVDMSEDAEIQAAQQQAADLAAAKQDAADAKADNVALKETVTTVKGALKELMTYVSSLPATTATQGGAE